MNKTGWIFANIIIFLLLVTFISASQYAQQIRDLPPISETGVEGSKSVFSMKPLFFSGSSEDCACIKTYECKPRSDGTIRRDCYSSSPGKCSCYSSPAGDTSDCNFHESVCGDGGGDDPYPTYPCRSTGLETRNCYNPSCPQGTNPVSGYDCPLGQNCCTGTPSCVSHVSSRCYQISGSMDVWWFDSCGNKETIRIRCPDYCQGTECVRCTKHVDCGENKCVRDVLQSYTCDNGECVVETETDCKHGCENAKCKSAPVCEEGDVGTPYCDGNNIIQLYRYSNCQEQGVTVDGCSYECLNGECVDLPPQCDCEEPEEWSACSDNTKTRKTWVCNEYTDYKCVQETETESCEVFDEICTNGIDDDSDERIDCDDPDCFTAEACETPPAECGDGSVDSGENCANCPADIKCKGELVCDEYDGKCKEVPGMPIIPIMIVSLVIIIVAGILLYMKVSKGK